MTLPVVFHDIAEEELDEAAAYYVARLPTAEANVMKA